ncbi:Transcriptional regulatory protein LiaR [Arthrobacter sp. Bi26]|uniref:helix-turn-helix transcriptional regulator n=1 Tax=Arthrobacter sp. Bi26 TaxID=2822350 RepID=UPI001D204D29|nr:LuxR C-terminal-related transcriptional regulator [Arthrobacter sp. Bi26]CAH0228824.1 Transcriptional regulatory protein LiaR [Arthrobacter sp. Bi26]
MYVKTEAMTIVSTVDTIPAVKGLTMAASTLEIGRTAFGRQAWANAFAELSAADRGVRLEPDDLELLATSAYLIGRDDVGEQVLARAHRERLRRADRSGAARCGVWLAIHLVLGGENARAGAWLARARRLLDDVGHDCAEQGYVLVLAGLESVAEGNVPTARATFSLAADSGDRFRDPDLMALARLGLAQSLVGARETTRAVELLDEIIVPVTAGEVSPVAAGIVYCAVIEACFDVFDLPRAQDWTAALSRWCAAQPDLVPYRGQCQVHRAQILQLHGAWTDAVIAVQAACRRLADPPDQPALGAAYYQLGELHRLCGEYAKAEAAYLHASRWVRDPQPGLALLRLVQGQIEAAAAAIRRSLSEAGNSVDRAKLLGPCVDIMLAAGDVPAARAATDELQGIAEGFGGSWLGAQAAQASGAVLVAEGHSQSAMAALRRAWTDWQELDAPYEAARVRVLMGLACSGLGDEHSAEMEFDAARWVFQELGALPDVARIDTLQPGVGHGSEIPLTVREREVLRLVASGQTNRAIAADLFLSERTVARHVSNIFTKLDLSSRSQATAFAYEHGLIQGGKPVA